MVLNKNRKPTLSPKTIFQVRVVSQDSFELLTKFLSAVMITIQKPIFCFRANPFLFYMKVCLHFCSIEGNKNYFSEVASVQAKTYGSIFPSWIVQGQG